MRNTLSFPLVAAILMIATPTWPCLATGTSLIRQHPFLEQDVVATVISLPADTLGSQKEREAEELTPYLSLEQVANSRIVLPAPPKPGSVEFLVDVYHYYQAKLLRNTPRGLEAIEDAKMDDTVLLRFADSFGFKVTKESMPRCYHLLKRAQECFGTYGCAAVKEYYQRIRPFDYFREPSLTPDEEEWLRKNGSYCSGHSANGYGLAAIMVALNPERQNEIILHAKEIAYSRVVVGAHWYSDTQASYIVALAVFARLQSDPEYLADFQLAKKEIETLRVIRKVEVGK